MNDEFVLTSAGGPAILMPPPFSDLNLWKLSCDTRFDDVVTMSFIGEVSVETYG